MPSVRDREVVLVWLVSSVFDQDLVFESLSWCAVNQALVFTMSSCGLPLLRPGDPCEPDGRLPLEPAEPPPKPQPEPDRSRGRGSAVRFWAESRTPPASLAPVPRSAPSRTDLSCFASRPRPSRPRGPPSPPAG